MNTSRSPQRRRSRTSTATRTVPKVVICALSLALLATASIAAAADVQISPEMAAALGLPGIRSAEKTTVCAAEGNKARDCGANNPDHPQSCCGSLICGGKKGQKKGKFCIEDENDVDETVQQAEVDPETANVGVYTGSATTARQGDPSAADDLIGDLGDEAVDLSDLASLTNTPPPPTESKIDLLRPIEAVNGLKPSGGIASAVFGSRKSRTWDMLIIPATIRQPDPIQQVTSPILQERDPFKFTEMPSAMPSESPSAVPSDMPSVPPSEVPSTSPTPFPTNYPTITMSPTEFLWTSEPRPSNIDNSYFDYDPTSPRGPNRWSGVRNSPETKAWGSLQEYIEDDLDENQCGNVNSMRQSPIDVRFDKSDGQCFEYHEIRHNAGEFSVADPKVDAQILPTKLRIDYPYAVLDPDKVEDMGNDRPFWTETKMEEDSKGRPKLTVKDAVKGPSADIPKGWGYQLPVTHVDIKIPSEHWMEGKQYAAEYQIYLIQNRKAQRGAPAISILIDLDPNDRPNAALQVALDRFQLEWDKDMAECEDRRRKERRLDAILGEEVDATQGQSSWLDEPVEEERKFQSYLRRAQEAIEPPQGGFTYFDPWDKELMRSIWFFGYEGSLTEPPCTEFLEWRIIDTPTTVSRAQLFQMKKLLFHHRDGNCKRTSTHYEGSVARPLQPYHGRLVHRCMCRDFIADRQRKKYGSNRCNWKDRDQFGFNKFAFTQEWYARTHKYENPDHQNCAVWNDCEDWKEELAERPTTTTPGTPGGGTTTTTPETSVDPWWWSF